MQFVDEVKISARSGKGGDGLVAFLREKYRPYGGPAGGDGGKGGDVVFVADPNLNTLLDFRFTRNWFAEDGGKGQSKNKSGSDAEDLIVRVPPGTVIYDDDTGEKLRDLMTGGERWIGLPGGKGGRGNQHFATPKNQAPKKAEPGGPAVEKTLRLELKLLADVGLVGYPNAGKSTLLSRVSAARPKIADYPFTTLVPNLGVVRPKGRKGKEAGVDRTFVVADIPGLIEGAHEGVGLGIRFLRHVERTALFLHVIDFADPADGGPWGRFEKVQAELIAYDAMRAQEGDHSPIASRPALLAANKMDLPDAQENLKALRKKFEKRGIFVVAISGVTGFGIDELIEALSSRVEEARRSRLSVQLEERS